MMNKHFRTFVRTIRGQADNKNSDCDLRLILFEITVYVILLWGLISIVNLPSIHTS